jgi:hypothetical protein
MMQPRLFGFILVFVVISSVFAGYFFAVSSQTSEKTDVYVGIDIAYGANIEEIKSLVDQVCSYTNLFVLGCTEITQDAVKLNEACQYLYDRGMYFIVYQEYPVGYIQDSNTRSNWPEKAKTRWGERFLGINYLDESGGRQLDLWPKWVLVSSADNYSDASRIFDNRIDYSVNWFRTNHFSSMNFPMFMSDYALYWFDYKGGYDVLLAQFGWNYSRQLNVALCRGAASVQNKDWGVMITWTYTEPPYMESGDELYEDLVLAYDNGAKYIVVFNSNKEYTQGILGDTHFDALKQFWQYAHDNPRNAKPVEDRVAFVLPKDYAYGFRGPEDKIWGLWPADAFSLELGRTMGYLLGEYGSALDIIYDDGLDADNTLMFSQLLRWDVYSLSASPMPLPVPSPIQLPRTTHSPSRLANSSSSPFLTQSPSESPLPQSTSSVEPQQTGAFSKFDVFSIAVVAVLVFAVVAGVSVHRTKKR